MSPQERQVLQDFLNQLVEVRGIVKDPEAQAMIANALAQQPDAPYLLVQRALLLDQALGNAKQEIAALQNQLRGSSPSSGAFLDANAWGNSGTMRPGYAAQPAPPAPAQYQMPAQAPGVGAAPGFLRGGMGGMLGTVAATAAGVAGGAFLFQGIEHLMGGGQHGAGHGLLGQQDDASAQNAFPSLTRPGEHPAEPAHLASEPSADDSSGLLDDVDNNYVDDIGGGDDSLFS
jgi:hypothetical protein